MQIIPMRDLKDTVKIEKRCAESQEPVFVTKNGYGRLVVMDIDLYEKTIQKAYEAKLINQSMEEINNGAKLIDGEIAKEGIMSRYEK